MGMKITNRHGLPEALVAAVKNDPYYSGGAELTASSMSTPPRIRALFREHADEIEEDVVDSIWKLLGQSIHVILERAGRSEIREKRLYADIEGVRVSSQLDSVTYMQGVITEWKLTSVWTIVYGGRADWIEQMNTQAEVLARNGAEPKRLRVVAILRDWQKSKAAQEKPGGTYPKIPVAVYDPIDLWTAEQRTAYILRRAEIHRRAALGDIDDCTPEEMWERQPGKRTRCLDGWCAVAPWCPQLAAFKQAQAERATRLAPAGRGRR